MDLSGGVGEGGWGRRKVVVGACHHGGHLFVRSAAVEHEIEMVVVVVACHGAWVARHSTWMTRHSTWMACHSTWMACHGPWMACHSALVRQTERSDLCGACPAGHESTGRDARGNVGVCTVKLHCHPRLRVDSVRYGTALPVVGGGGGSVVGQGGQRTRVHPDEVLHGIGVVSGEHVS